MQLGLRNEQPKEFAMFPSRFFVGLITKMFFFQFFNLLVKLHLWVFCCTLSIYPTWICRSQPVFESDFIDRFSLILVFFYLLMTN